jgi:hypothetical protein
VADPLVPAVSSSDAVIQTLKWVRKQGFKPVPLRKQSKAAIGQGYVDVGYAPPDDQYWFTRDVGLGVVTGPSHSGPLDIDLDCKEAIFFASRFLPPTSAVFGRPSKPASHYLYRGPEGLAVPKKAFNDPLARKGATIVEIRGDGGHQTVFPGSLHETSGEQIAWHDTPFPDVPHVPFDTLDLAVKKIAIATLVCRHMWIEGQRNEINKHLSGLFYYVGWTEEETKCFITAIMDYMDDPPEDRKTRLKTVTLTYQKGDKGGKVTGAGGLKKFLGEDRLVDRILEWVGNEVATMIQDYNERFAVVSLEGKFRVADTSPLRPSSPPVFYGKEDFVNFMAPDVIEYEGERKPKAAIWLKSVKRRSYREVDFLPGVEDVTDTLNLWTGWGVKPEPQASCSGWLDLLFYTVCGGDAELNKWMLNWFANIVREPMSRLLTSPVITGKQGAGKSLLFRYFGKILGQCYMPVSNPEHIYGKFNKHLASTLLLHSEEALFAGEQRHSNIIKALITDETRVFEQKGIDAKNVKNYLRLCFTSNDLWAVRAEDGDRRYTIVDMGERKITPETLAQVLTELENGGPSGLLYYLLNVHKYEPDVVRINIKNEALLKLKEVNFDPIAGWWFETLRLGQILPDYLWWAQIPARAEWPESVSQNAIYNSMSEHLKAHGARYVPSIHVFVHKLRRMTGFEPVKKFHYLENPMSDNAPIEVRRMNTKQYCIDNLPDLASCRRAFEGFVGQAIQWPGPPEPQEIPLSSRY